MIRDDDQMLLAQECVGNLRRVLLEARKVHSRQDYLRLAEPILLEVQQREKDILEYLTSDLEQPVGLGLARQRDHVAGTRLQFT